MRSIGSSNGPRTRTSFPLLKLHLLVKAVKKRSPSSIAAATTAAPGLDFRATSRPFFVRGFHILCSR
jgi:hypothetical protein